MRRPKPGLRYHAGMTEATNHCFECKRPLVEIDNRGKRLTGSMNCNIWWSSDDKKVRLSEEDLRALHAMRRRAPGRSRRPARLHRLY